MHAFNIFSRINNSMLYLCCLPADREVGSEWPDMIDRQIAIIIKVFIVRIPDSLRYL